MPQQNPFRYDFAISFSGAQREIAKEIAEGLKRAGITVFYDKDEVDELLGEDGEIYLRKLYSTEARFYIVLVSREYDKSPWTNMELDAIRSRESIEHEGVLLPVIAESYKPKWLSRLPLVGSYKPKWLPRERIFLDLREYSVPLLVEALGKKLSHWKDSNIGNVHRNAADCEVFIRSGEAGEPTTEALANLTQKTESILQGLGFRVEYSYGPRRPDLCPSVVCTPEDRLVGLLVKVVIDTLLSRSGPLESGLKGPALISLETREDSETSPGKLTLHLS